MLFYLLILPVVLAGYCTGPTFSASNDNCSKFHFSKLKSSGQCTDSKKATTGEFHGLALTNCTTQDLPDQTMDDRAIDMAQLITNVFENGNTKMGYAAIEKLGDCRGYTCGYIGFTTGTNDVYAVVKEYVNRQPKSALKRYLPALYKLTKYDFGDPKRDNTSGLKGFVKAWRHTTHQDPIFSETQLDVGQSMYLKPALKYAASVGVHSNLGKAIFYDTIVQHGWQYVEPMINLPRIIQLTGPKKNETEKSYLTRFMTIRRQLVCCYPGGAWNDSADRMKDWQTLIDDWSHNKDLLNPVKVYGKTVFEKHAKKNYRKSLPIPDTC